MPFINGIELARILKRDYPTIKLGFISGYDEFDYAREAIELNVVSYIMKPITTDDLEEFLRKLKKLLDEEKKQIEDIESLKDKYEQSVPKIIDSNLNAYTYKEKLRSRDIETLVELGLDIMMNQFFVATIDLSKSLSSEKILPVKGIIDKALAPFGLVTSFRTRDGLVILAGSKKPYSKNEIDAFLFEVTSYIKEFLNLDTAIGVSNIFKSLEDFPKHYIESRNAKNHGIYYKIGSIVFYADIDASLIENVSLDEDLLADFDYAIKYYDKLRLEQYLNNLQDKILADDKHHYNRQYFLLNVANRIVKFSESLSSTNVLSTEIINQVLSFKGLDQLFSWIYHSAIKIREENSSSQVNKVENLVERAFNVIEKEYSDNSLNLEAVAEELDISVSYLSSLIKKHKQLTFNKYLIKVRMEKAMELLRYSNEKIINISEAVGYNEVYYFSHSFKKFTTMSPKEYRKNYANT
jgi:two-component system response regulator YesN